MIKKLNELLYEISDDDCEELKQLHEKVVGAENELQKKKTETIKELQRLGVDKYYSSFEWKSRPLISIKGNGVRIMLTSGRKGVTFSFYIDEKIKPEIVQIKGFDGKFQIERKVGNGRYLVKSLSDNYYINNVWKSDIIRG